MKTFARKLSSVLPAVLLACAVHAEDAKPAPTLANAGISLAGAPASHQSSPPFLAVVNGTVISSAEFDSSANEAARQKFYHGKPPEGAIEQLMRDVANKMIDRVLLLEEVKRQGLKPDTKAVGEKIASYEERYATSPRWQQERDKILPGLRERLEQDDMLAALETKTRKVAAPGEDKVRAYYKAHPEKFTEPEKMRLSLIVLKVDPSSPTAAWQAAETEAGALRMQLTEGGATFAELAKKHSADDSAEKGGDLGYLHRGMLPEGIQDKIDDMKPGDLSVPTRILQGYALFRYEARQEPKHHEFATVRARASDLLAREQSEEAWNRFLTQLRKKAKIQLNTQRYTALAQQSAASK
jgi:parvulin-like peptidyl-prolyl isomerase